MLKIKCIAYKLKLILAQFLSDNYNELLKSIFLADYVTMHWETVPLLFFCPALEMN